jgi:hypothetical protein
MSKKPNKSLLNEATIRRMMKLASVDSLTDSFISNKYAPLAEKQGYKDEEDESLSMRTGPESDHKQSMKARRDDSYGKFGDRDEEHRDVSLEEESDMEKELDATEDELGAEDREADDEGAELDALESGEGEVSITDEEAQDIIDLADKLRAATGDSAEEMPEIEMDMEVSEETPEEEMMQEESALSLDDLKEEVYKKVINRLVAEAKKK